MNDPLRNFLRLLPAVLAFMVAGCGGGADSGGDARIRVLNLSSGYQSIDLYSNDGDDDTDTQRFTGVERGSITGYAVLKGDTHTLKFRKSGTTGNLLSSSATIADGTHTTYVTFGDTNQFSVLAIDEETDDPDSGYTKVQVFNTSLAGNFDVYLTGAEDSLDDVSATISAVTAGSASSITTVTSGSYRLRITGEGVKTDLRLNVPEIALASKGVLSIILTDTEGGVLVNAVLLPKQGSPTTYDNTATAQLRVLNVSSGYSPLDVYKTTSSSDTDVVQFTSIARSSATAYASLKADSYTFKFRRSGTAGNLQSVTATLAEDAHITYVAYGTTNHFGALAINEEVEQPNSGYTKVQVLNTLTADSLDVYLMGTDDSLSDVSPTVSAAAAGALSSVTTIRSGTYRLQITGSGSKTDLRLDVPSVTLANKGIVSIILTENAGGVLVSAVLLPQQGAPEVHDNTSARIRGAVGLSSGALATVTVASTSIVAGRSARSYIADTYTTLAAGSVPVSVSVDGTTLATGVASLEAGRDYTLLVWDVGGGTQYKLIADDNQVPTSGQVKLRLMNGMAGLGAPLTLSVNYSSVAEYVDLGAASEFDELSPGTSYTLDVTNSLTLASLLLRESVILQANGVYTLFMAGGGGSAVAGTLRKDR